ncbi:hypothetical protein, variant [Magnaporthiopsis poae ATCC 64411]|uniref:Uncharacterized protein n=1 Tax=Magnaporthiopsis poae (strain ATCC 64411 / 73-15) TaxID=644358 RepID=A0A0C4E085_MAGP6|nr:hypothetical protein, variant [Magnaporthiopsis poae ATCC 64411]
MARNRETNGGSRGSPAASGRPHPGPTTLLVVVLLFLLAAPSYAADFIRTFTGITKGADLALQWDGIDARYMPLTIHVVVVNRTDEENRANVFKRNLAVGVNGTSWVWRDMPSPLPYMATGLYQVEIRPEAQANATTGNAPTFPKSPYFSLLDAKSSKPPVSGVLSYS